MNSLAASDQTSFPATDLAHAGAFDAGTMPPGQPPRSPIDHAAAETSELAELLGRPRLDAGRLGSVVHSLHAAVQSGPLEVMDLGYRCTVPGAHIADHSRNVAKLSMYLAEQRGYRPPTVRVVGLAALLHDVGMRSLPQEALASPKPPEPDTAQKLWDHPEHSARIIASTDHLGSLLRNVVPAIVRQHHERCDGSGYPAGLRGRQINELARILGIADSFEAMVSPRAYRPPRHPSQAMAQLLLDTYDKAGEGLYDRDLVKTFLQALSLYPVGCMVKISDGCVARVVHSNPGHPKRPVVRPLIGPTGQAMPSADVIDVAERPELSITGPWWEQVQ